MFSDFADKIYSFVSKIPFGTLIQTVWGAYAGVFILTFILCLAVKRVRARSKSPYLAFTNAFAALNLSLFMLEKDFSEAVMITVLFWTAGYLTYGILCAFAPKKKTAEPVRTAEPVYIAPPPVTASKPAKAEAPVQAKISAPAAKNGVRLEHAVAVTGKLLEKNLSKADRQELEKLKNTLAVLQIKGTLTPTEAEILNENFNALLKLMAKYNV